MTTGVGEVIRVILLHPTTGAEYAVTGSSGGVSQVDNSAFSAGTDSGTPVEGLYEATPSTLTDGRAGVIGITANRVVKAGLHNADGSAITTLPVSLASVPSHAVTNAGTFAVQESGAALTALQVIDDWDNTASDGASVSGDVAHDDVDAGEPVKIGGKAASSAPTNVTAGDRVNQWFGLSGAPVMGAFGSAGADGESNTAGFLIGSDGNVRALPVQVRLFNGSTWDRIRGDTTNGLDVDVTRLPSATIAGTTAATGSGTATGALRVELPTNGTGTLATVSTVTTVSTLTGGGIAHDSADSGNPHKIGMKAVDIGTQPTAVTANDRTDWYANRNGVPWVLGGSPAIVTKQLNVTDADGAQTDTALVTVSAGTAIVVTAFQAMCDGANTGDVAYRVGFGTANTPAADAAGIISSHPGVKSGSGVVVGNGAGVIGMGASNEDLRVTCEDPAGGAIDFIVTYFTVLIG